jgi:hypothetical protein
MDPFEQEISYILPDIIEEITDDESEDSLSIKESLCVNKLLSLNEDLIYFFDGYEYLLEKANNLSLSTIITQHKTGINVINRSDFKVNFTKRIKKIFFSECESNNYDNTEELSIIGIIKLEGMKFFFYLYIRNVVKLYLNKNLKHLVKYALPDYWKTFILNK